MKDFEKEFFIAGPAGPIQATYHKPDEQGVLFDQKRVAVICHPHPQHGGTMDNKVVTTLMRTYRDLGISVVRFNFRGVGKSQGEFDSGRGEFEDLIAVIHQTIQDFPENKLMLAGFSFGSSIVARASYSFPLLTHLCLVAPPIERYEYDRDLQFPVPTCVIQGDKDERVVAQGVYDWCATLKSSVDLIRYADATHFFHGYLTQMKQDLTQHLISLFAPLGSH